MNCRSHKHSRCISWMAAISASGDLFTSYWKYWTGREKEKMLPPLFNFHLISEVFHSMPSMTFVTLEISLWHLLNILVVFQNNSLLRYIAGPPSWRFASKDIYDNNLLISLNKNKKSLQKVLKRILLLCHSWVNIGINF